MHCALELNKSLHSSHFFCQIAGIATDKSLISLKKGQTLFTEGSESHGIYCIHEGIIKISKIELNGKESIVRIATKGDIIGHRSLFNQVPCAATATALQNTVVCYIEQSYILKSMENSPALSLNIISKLSHELGSAENKVASLFQKNVRERLAELMISLKNNFGILENNEYRLNIKLTREELASMIGVANETLIRFMTEFKEENLIRQERKTIFITDLMRLLKLANLKEKN